MERLTHEEVLNLLMDKLIFKNTPEKLRPMLMVSVMDLSDEIQDELERRNAQTQEHAEKLALKGWQYFECPACGSEGARAFPQPEQETSRPIYIAEVTMPEPDDIGPWCDGSSWCLNCHHEWVAVWPLGAESLECPACGSTDTDRDQEGPHERKKNEKLVSNPPQC